MEWRPRRYNNVADHLAAVTVAGRQTWDETVFEPPFEEHMKLKLCTDGSYSGNNGSGAYVLLAKPDSVPRICSMGGVFLETCRSAFETEVLALERGLDIICNMLIK